jgi:hypothetical protein
VTQEKIVVFSYGFVKFGTFIGVHVVGRFIIIISVIIIITLVLQPTSALTATTTLPFPFCLLFWFSNC